MADTSPSTWEVPSRPVWAPPIGEPSNEHNQVDAQTPVGNIWAPPGRAATQPQPQTQTQTQWVSMESAVEENKRHQQFDLPGIVPAAWWKRSVAMIIDLAAMNVMGSILLFVGIGHNATLISNPDTGNLQVTSQYPAAFWFAVGIIGVLEVGYFTFMNGSTKGQTLGKMVMKIAVRDINSGSQISHARSMARILLMGLFFSAYLVPLVIDCLWPLLEPRHRSWHDMATRSIVVDLAR